MHLLIINSYLTAWLFGKLKHEDDDVDLKSMDQGQKVG
jgi:hypothetical protein